MIVERPGIRSQNHDERRTMADGHGGRSEISVSTEDRALTAHYLLSEPGGRGLPLPLRGRGTGRLPAGVWWCD